MHSMFLGPRSRRIRRVVLAAALALVTAFPAAPGIPEARANGTPGAGESESVPAPGSPLMVVISAFAGVPRDSAGGDAFWIAFRSTFLEQGFVTEKPGAREGRFNVSVPLINRAVLLEGSGGPWDDEAYRVSLDVSPLPAAPRDTAARAVIAVTALPPGTDPRLVRVAPAVDTLRFEKGRGGAPAGLAALARNAAILVIERVHRIAGELPEGERLVLEGARRTGARAGIAPPRAIR